MSPVRKSIGDVSHIPVLASETNPVSNPTAESLLSFCYRIDAPEFNAEGDWSRIPDDVARLLPGQGRIIFETAILGLGTRRET